MQPDAYAQLLLGNVTCPASSVVVRRALLDKTGLFRTTFAQAEDYDLWLRCARLSGLAAAPGLLLTKVAHDHSLGADALATLLWRERVLVDMQRMHGPHGAFRTHGAQGEHHAHSGERHASDNAVHGRAALARIRYQTGSAYCALGQPLKGFACYVRGAAAERTAANTLLCIGHLTAQLIRFASCGLIRIEPSPRYAGPSGNVK
jgi:hypothetical protein